MRVGEKHSVIEFQLAEERYASLGVNVSKAMQILATIPVSLHCWQGDDVAGFESGTKEIGGGLAVTGCYPGRARTPQELREDIDQAMSLIPGRHRLNLHAFYGEFAGRAVDRNEIDVEHFQNWIAWAKERRIGLDFNPTCYAHHQIIALEVVPFKGGRSASLTLFNCFLHLNRVNFSTYY